MVQARIGEFLADAVVVSTDRFFTVEPHWHLVVAPGGDFDPVAHRPSGWDVDGWGRSEVSERVWFVDVTRGYDEAGDRPFERLGAALRAVAAANLPTLVKGRPLPLVAVPVIGVGRGGRGHRRGEVIDQLLRVCRDSTSHGIDVVVVTTTASTHAALQHQRRRSPETYHPGTEVRSAERLGRLAQEGSLALFMGAGVSVPAGAPSWRDLIDRLGERAGLDHSMIESFARLSPLDQAELLGQMLGQDALASMISDEIGRRRPALGHVLLAALGCKNAVTTNYDDLYEQAVRSSGDQAISVLPSQIPHSNDRWVLKMHGDLAYPKSIVLTRGQFVGFSSSAGPSGAVLQSLLLTRHLLIVGTSMTDDNVLRLIHEVMAYRQLHRPPSTAEGGEQERLGTVLEVGDDPARRKLHEAQFIVELLPGTSLDQRARNLEIFLDAVAMYAARDHSWLLDPTFDYLLDEPAQSLAAEVREVARRIEDAAGHGDAWRELASQLGLFGAPDLR